MYYPAYFDGPKADGAYDKRYSANEMEMNSAFIVDVLGNLAFTIVEQVLDATAENTILSDGRRECLVMICNDIQLRIASTSTF